MLCLAVEPEALSHLHISFHFGALAVLVTVFPHAIVGTSISPHVDTEAVLLIELIVTFVASAICPLVQATAVHGAREPVTLVTRLAICMLEFTISVKKIVLEIAFIHSSVLANLATLRALLTFEKHAFICLSVKLLLKAFAMGAIIEEFSFINKLDLPCIILSLHFPIAAGHPVEEDTLYDCSSCNNRLSSIAMRLTPDKPTLVLIAVWPLYLTLTIREPLLLIFTCIYAHLACVD